MGHKPMVFGNKLNTICLYVVFWSLPLNIQTHRHDVYHKCWSKHENDTDNSISSYQIGFFDGMSYQLAFVNERRYIELQCRYCNEQMAVVPIQWSLHEFIRNSTDDTSTNINITLSKLQIGSVKKGFTILETGYLFFKAKLRHSGLYHCRGQSANYSINLSPAFSYYLAIVPQTEVPLVGSVSDSISYRNDVVEPIRDDIQLLAIFGEDSQNNRSTNPIDVDIFYTWTEWGQCVCGTFKYDTVRYRYGYCCVRIAEFSGNVIVLPCAGDHLIEASYPQFAATVANVSTFKEYERCMDECVPDALEDDVVRDYMYKRTFNVPYLGHLELRCPKSDGSKDILWLRDEEILLKPSDSCRNLRICVDTENILLLTEVTTKEDGYYACLVDGVPIARNLVRINAKQIFLTAECVKSMVILAIVVTCCFFIYAIIVYSSVRSLNEREI